VGYLELYPPAAILVIWCLHAIEVAFWTFRYEYPFWVPGEFWALGGLLATVVGLIHAGVIRRWHPALRVTVYLAFVGLAIKVTAWEFDLPLFLVFLCVVVLLGLTVQIVWSARYVIRSGRGPLACAACCLELYSSVAVLVIWCLSTISAAFVTPAHAPLGLLWDEFLALGALLATVVGLIHAGVIRRWYPAIRVAFYLAFVALVCLSIAARRLSAKKAAAIALSVQEQFLSPEPLHRRSDHQQTSLA
jgi:hypothetical protein